MYEIEFWKRADKPDVNFFVESNQILAFTVCEPNTYFSNRNLHKF